MESDIDGCDICGQNHDTEDCPIFFQDDVHNESVLSRARITIPANVTLLEDEDKKPIVLAKEVIPAKTKLGPYEAKKNTHASSPDNIFVLKIFNKGKENCVLDTSDEYLCNWMCFIPTARNTQEVNCIAVQIGSDIYYITTRNIEPGVELRVWYAPHYAKKMGMPADPDGTTKTMYGIGLPTANIEMSFDTSEFDLSMSPYKQANLSESDLYIPDKDEILDVHGDVSERIVDGIKVTVKVEDEVASSTTAKLDAKIEVVDTCSEDKELKTDSVFQPDPPDTKCGKRKTRERLFGKRKALELDKTESKTMKLESDLNSSTSDLQLSSISNIADDDKVVVKRKSKLDPKVLAFLKKTRKSKTLKYKRSDVCLSGADCSENKEPEIENPEQFNLTEDQQEECAKINTCIAFSVVEESSDGIFLSTENDRSRDFTDQDSDNTVEVISSNKAPTPAPRDSKKTELICKHCGVQYSKTEVYAQHVALCNPLVSTNQHFTCSKCNEMFTSEILYKLHMKKHEKLSQRTVCTRTFETESALDEHDCSGQKPRKYSCPECVCEFKHERFLKRHMALHTGEFTCVICSKVFERKASLIKHMIECTANVRVKTVGKIECTVCGTEFTDAKLFQSHYMEHTHPFSCTNCNARFAREHYLNKHTCKSYTGEKFQCDVCHKTYKKPEYLEKHKQVHKSNQFYCDRCEKTFKRIEMWKCHMCRDDEGNRVLLNRRKNGKEVRLTKVSTVCTICGKTYHNVSNLTKHMKRHFEKTEKCDQCGMMFHEPSGLKAHKENIHGSREPKWACDVCGKKMKCRNSLYTHKKSFHQLNNVVYQCSECYRQFKTKSYLMKHVEGHKKEKVLFCDECPKNFKTEYQLQRHQEWHMNGDKIDCDQCLSSFATHSELKRHLRRKHAGIMFCCKYCNNLCVLKETMRKHLEKYHASEQDWQQNTEDYLSSLAVFIKEYVDKHLGEEVPDHIHSNTVTIKKELVPPLNPLSPARIEDAASGKVILAEVHIPDTTGNAEKQTILIQTADDAITEQTDISQQVLEALQQITTTGQENLRSQQPGNITLDTTSQITLPNGDQGYYLLPAGFDPATAGLIAVKELLPANAGDNLLYTT